MKKTHKVVMLSTEKASPLFSYKERPDLLYYQPLREWTSIVNHLHLYIISDDEIKEGDWFTTSIDSSKYHHNTPIHQCTSRPKDKDEVFNWVSTREFTFKPESCKKIVATTDKSLEEEPVLGYQRPLPQLPESFIQAYIKAYNEGKPITEVALEMMYIPKDKECLRLGEIPAIKTREDNTVIIHKVEQLDLRPYKSMLLSCLALKMSRTTSDYYYEVAKLHKLIQDNL